MRRYKVRYFGLLAVLLALPALTCGFGPAFQDLIERVEALEAETDLLRERGREIADILQEGLDALAARVDVIEQVLFSEPVETVLLDDDFEDGMDPGWVQVIGTTQTIAPTSDCIQDYWSGYENCGSLGLYLDELQRHEFLLPAGTRGSFSLYFHDDPAETHAFGWVGLSNTGGGIEVIGLNTEKCPNHYALALTAGDHQCTSIRRRVGWHRVEFIRDGTSSRGYLNHILVFETIHPGRNAFDRLTLTQHYSLEHFAIDDVRFVATE